jgi:hypothetical protein
MAREFCVTGPQGPRLSKTKDEMCANYTGSYLGSVGGESEQTKPLRYVNRIAHGRMPGDFLCVVRWAFGTK